MNIILMPDSFKGTLSSKEICEIEKRAILNIAPESLVTAIPVADGGEGTCDCFHAALKESEKVTVTAVNPFFEKKEIYYLKAGDTAIIESAMCCGFGDAQGRKNPAVTTTFGVGQVMKAAIDGGAKKLLIGLGGSSTNDCGAGMAAALGVEFKDKSGKTFVPTGATLSNVVSIQTEKADNLLSGIEVTAMCDVKNPLYGENGAAYIFAPQKGANEKMVLELDKGLRKFSETLKRELSIDVANIEGAGAAGGMGAGIVAFTKGRLESGIDSVLRLVEFDKKLDSADLVITGEGKLDSQSFGGKVISGIAKRAKLKNVPVIALCGAVDENIEKAYEIGVSAVFSINRKAEDFSVSRNKSRENLEKTTEDIMRLIKTIEVHDKR